jgi:hypothetical protein
MRHSQRLFLLKSVLLWILLVLLASCGRLDWNSSSGGEEAPRALVLSVLSSPGTALASNVDGAWVAVGKQTIWYSPDGVAWGVAQGATANDWRAVASAPDGKCWVAVGFGGIATSPDGKVWTAAKGDIGPGWQSVAVSSDGKRWVAAGFDGLASSSDGIHWESVAQNLGAGWREVAMNAGRWVVVGIDGIAGSSDGVNWRQLELPLGATSYFALSLTPHGKQWLALGADRIAWSSDGRQWKEVLQDKEDQLVALAADERRWVSCGANGLRSSSGLGQPDLPDTVPELVGGGQAGRVGRWEAADLGIATFNCQALTVRAEGAGYRWIAAGSEGLFTSLDGSRWTRVDAAMRGFDWDVVQAAASGHGWVALGWSGLATSPDGVSWRRNPGALVGHWQAVAQDVRSRRLVAIGTAGMVTSLDGARWEAVLGDPGEHPSALAVSNESGVWVAGGESSLAMSRDGRHWQRATVQWPNWRGDRAMRWRAVAHSDEGKRWVAVGTHGMATSVDGLIWVQATGAAVGSWSAVVVAPDGKRWVAAGADGIAVSDDGQHWTLAFGESFGEFAAISVDKEGSRWLANDGRRVLTSRDGKTWENSNLPREVSGMPAWSAPSGRWLNSWHDGIAVSKDGLHWNLPWQFQEKARGVATNYSPSYLRRQRSVAYDTVAGALVSDLRSVFTDSFLFADSPPGVFVLDGVLWRVEHGGHKIGASAGRWERAYDGGQLISFRLFGEPKACPGNQLKATMLGSSEHDFSDNVLPMKLLASQVVDVAHLPRGLAMPFDPVKLGLAEGQQYRVALQLSCDDWEVMTPAFEPTLLTFHPTPLPAWVYLPIVLLGLAGILCVLHRYRPLWVLALYLRTKTMGGLGGANIPVLDLKVAELLQVTNLFVILWLVKRPRTLDSWVRDRQVKWLDAFAAEATVRRCSGYEPLPSRLDGAAAGDTPQVSGPEGISRLLEQGASCVEIVGPGGAGKTMLLIQVCRCLQRHDGGAVQRPRCVVLIDEDTVDAAAVARAKLQVGLAEDLDADLFGWLLKSGNVVLAFDRLSERDDKTIQHVRLLRRSLVAAAILVSTREAQEYEGVRVVRVLPQPLGPDTLGPFMQALLRQHPESTAISTFREVTDLQTHLVDMIQLNDREVELTPLVASLFIRRAVKLVGEGHAMSDLPGSVPDAYFSYLTDVNPTEPTAEHWLSHEDMLRAARCLALLSLGRNCKPQDFSREAAERALEQAGWPKTTRAVPIKRLILNGILVEQRRLGARHMLSFALDPLAEFLAADEELARCGGLVEAEDRRHREIDALGDDVRDFKMAFERVLANRRGPRAGAGQRNLFD